MQQFNFRIQQGIFFFIIFFILPACAQKTGQKLRKTPFNNAEIQWNSGTQTPRDIKLEESASLSKDDFFTTYKQAFDLSASNTFHLHREHTDESGESHARYKQQYKGIEIADARYVVHTNEDDQVYHAHGNLVHDLDIDVTPSLSEQEARSLAYEYAGKSASVVTQENYKNSNISALPIKPTMKSKVMIASKNQSNKARDYRLVYRFDVLTTKPLSRYNIDIDAHTGELVNKIPTIYDNNIETKGISLYNDTVDITISDDTFMEAWALPSEWHLNDWEAFGGSGTSWWMADTLLGDIGGYSNGWYDALQTDPIVLDGWEPELTFYHRYAVEPPEDYEEYDGWDGMNVRISTDGGNSWEVLSNPSPDYTCSSLYSFGFQHGEGVGIPGWAGIQEEWEQVTFDLEDYMGDTVIIRFAFASDPAYSTADEDPELFGWQVDNITISNASTELYSNNGNDSNAETNNLFRLTDFVEGDYRLREMERGSGIATFNGQDNQVARTSVDFVENDTFFNADTNRAGVGLHWAAAKTYDYFYEKHNRLSYDDMDSRVIMYANWVFETGNGVSQNNAQWLGSAAVFGGGDGTFYDSWGTLDITGHEFTHGVIEYSAGLIYQNEPGALNESFCDIFGTAIEFYAEQNSGEWLIGEDHALSGPAVRSMSNPNELNSPDTYLGNYWISTTGTPTQENDYGGVHTNSGVQNYWFYLLSEGGSGTNDDDFSYDVNGIGLEDAEYIAYRTLTTYLVPQSGFHDAAIYSLESAIDLFGEDSQQANAVVDAWEAVGVYFGPSLYMRDTYDFEMVVNQNINRYINIANKGTKKLTITDIEIDGDAFSLNSLPSFPVEVDPSGPYSLAVSFLPTDLETYEGTLTIHSNDTVNPVKTVQLIGTGVESTVPVDYATAAPERTELLDAYPNPFARQTIICFSTTESYQVDIDIVNSSGRIVQKLTSQSYDRGIHEITWNGTDSDQRHVAPGNYIVWMRVNGESFTKTILKK